MQVIAVNRRAQAGHGLEPSYSSGLTPIPDEDKAMTAECPECQDEPKFTRRAMVCLYRIE
ncbi:hypothetical protein EVA_22246 [gut metagenome]|uniref:Uncharacterized protein n=1 Tax=gut metagenome TaxID=749906 RepID=J9F420_9ZZZZ